jgi:hypothetical protein
MPSATDFIRKANYTVGGSAPEAQAQALQAVEAASSVADVIAALQFFDDMEDAIATEANAVLAAIPGAIDQALLGALRSALGRNLPVSFSWQEEDVIGVRITESTDGGGEVSITLITPHGTTFVS